MQKRKYNDVSQPAGSAQASGASRDSGVSQSAVYEAASGVSQPADNEGARILVVDAGWIKDRIAQQLVTDERPSLYVNDILETTELLNATIIVGYDSQIVRDLFFCARHFCSIKTVDLARI